MYFLWLFLIFLLFKYKFLFGRLNNELLTACNGALILSAGGIRPYIQVLFFVSVYILMCFVMFFINLKYKNG